MNISDLLHKPINKLTKESPIMSDFLSTFKINSSEELSFSEFLDDVTEEFWEIHTTNKEELLNLFIEFTNGIFEAEKNSKIEHLEVVAGFDKSNKPEQVNLKLVPGEVTCIVGPTGSGKSRLLADIEWLANADTPTKRKVLINGNENNEALLSAYGGKLVAQITQNMNFVLDMDVYSFLLMHAQSRYIENSEEKVNEVIQLANELSGEAFASDTPVTFLSGGQSRALMIADVACIGESPIVLIDEIENAGVDKRRALELLVKKDKIVLMATHDPLLILLADKRVVIKNGGMHKILRTNEYERKLYNELEELDNSMQKARNFFRQGNALDSDNELF
jgi:ABC-type lipoprotein export system ATPase subunit